MEDIISALKALGYKATEAKARAEGAVAKLGEGASIQSLIREALKRDAATIPPELKEALRQPVIPPSVSLNAPKKLGRPVTKGERSAYPMRLPNQFFNELKLYASLKREPLSDIIENALKLWWDSQRDQKADMARELANLDSERTRNGEALTLEDYQAIAQFQHSKRTRLGLDAARERGAKIGRPKADVDLEKLKALKVAGKSLREIAQELEIGASTVHRLLAEVFGETQTDERQDSEHLERTT